MGFTSFRPKFYRVLAVIALVGVTTLYLNGTRIALPENSLSRFLGDFQYRSDSAWQVGLFGGRTRWNSMDHFVRVQGEYDQQRNYGLLDRYSEARYQRAFSRIADEALTEFVSFHGDQLKDGVRSGLGRAIDFEQLRQNYNSSLMVAGVAAAIYTGRTLRYRLGSDLALESQTLMRTERKQYLGWSSVGIGASGGGTYDAIAGQMNYSFHKRLTSNVSMDYEKSTDHSVGVSYTAGF